MLLVMHTAGILQSSEAEQSQLWKLTWDRIDTFLPTLKEEVFKPHQIGKKHMFCHWKSVGNKSYKLCLEFLEQVHLI